jgi:hypothetical protein
MSSPDLRGNPSAGASRPAQDAAEQALWRMMSFYDSPLADLDAAIAADAGWALPHAMKAGYLLSLTEASLVSQAQAHLAQARALAASASGATPRERAHLDAVEQVQEGRWDSACRLWDALLLDHPRDALALHWLHLWDYYRGDALGMRQHAARALPAWDEADPLFPQVLALYAFGLEECNQLPQAEDVGRRALALDPRVPWAIHAVTHVMEMQGRYEEGAAWLRQQQAHWAEGNGFAGHLWWHKSLFRLEALDRAGALRLLDTHLSGPPVQLTLQRLDAAALLWRLHLLGEDVAARGAALLHDWELGPGTAGHYAFNDLHAVLTMILAGDVARAESWLARCAERAMTPADARRSNHAMAREVGLPLMRGLVAFARGDADGAAALIYPVRPIAQRFGGSHAQRDLIDQTLLAAAAQAQRWRPLGQALINERRMAKPQTPLTRYWLERLSPIREIQG